MNPGLMKYKVKVKELSEVTNEFGAKDTTYTDKFELWGAVKFLSGSKSIDNFELFNSSAVQVTVYKRDITEKDVIELNSVNYKINSISPSDDNLYLILNCEKVNE